MGWLESVLIALDQLANALLRGWPDETLSSRAWRLALTGCLWPARIINIIFLDSGHCRESYESERLRRQLPPEFRTDNTRSKHGL